MSKALQPIDEVRQTFTKMGPEFRALLPTVKDVERFQRVAITALQRTPALLDCDRRSLYAAAMKCAEAGLNPDGTEAAFVAYGKTVQFLPMIDGLLKKLYQSGCVAGAPRVHVVKERDAFEFELGDNERIIHKPAMGDRGKTIGAYSIVKLKDGEVSREFMSLDEIESVRKISRAKDSGPWVNQFDEMARKTVFRRHYKKLPKIPALEGVIEADNEAFNPEPIATTATVTDALPEPDTPRQPRALKAVKEAAPMPEPVLVPVDDDGGDPI